MNPSEPPARPWSYTLIIGAQSSLGKEAITYYRRKKTPLILWDPKWIGRSDSFADALGNKQEIEICATSRDLDLLAQHLDELSPRYRASQPQNLWRVNRLIWAGEHDVSVEPGNPVDLLQALDQHITTPLALASAVSRHMAWHQERSEILVMVPHLYPGTAGSDPPGVVRPPRAPNPALIRLFVEAEARRRFVTSVGSTAGIQAAITHVRVPDELYGRLASSPTVDGIGIHSSAKLLWEILAELARQKPATSERWAYLKL